jgi:eukaryotic-like serine/threonine-protein kinase
LSVIESTIDGRYEVITRVAAGGMGEVYRAHDSVLGREVAIKILHPHLAGDRGFVDRFRREARAAAILNHPSIVGVYDWGTTDGTYFMVMEFVHGTNLRALLAEAGRFEPSQVVEVAMPVLAALDHAHGHGIVHRDIKPENILIAHDGTVKVADFGLARAYAESNVSQAEGTVTGTVQYLAPEQIQGDPADPRTDLYALGVVMFELLTGEPPFTGETSMAIAYQHLSSAVPAPSRLDPNVPRALDRAVLHATARDREDRPASARTLRDEVARAGVGLPPAPGLVQLVGLVPPTEAAGPERATTVTIPRPVSPNVLRRRRIRAAAALVLLVALLGVGGWATWVYAIPHYVRLPSLTGIPQDQAMARLRGLGLTPRIGPGEFSTSVESGAIIRTDPAAGTKVRTRHAVTIIPSKGPELALLPDVRGATQADAVAALTEAGFTPLVVTASSETVPKGHVIDQNPEGGHQVVKGLGVTVTVSTGPPPVQIPDLASQPQASAQTALENLGFTVKIKQEFSDTIPAGDVIGTDPPAGSSAPKGSRITLIVSKGPKSFAMPDVRGMTMEAAKAELQGLGLVVDVIVLPGTTGDQVVLQSPDPGTTVHAGDTVKIYVTGP